MQIHAASYGELVNGGWQPRAPLTIVAGENGSGKSSVLRALVERSEWRDGAVLAVTGTHHHRFSSLALGDYLLSPSSPAGKPDRVLKRAIVEASKQDELQLRSLSRALRHSGYWPTVGVKIQVPVKRAMVRSDEIAEEAAAYGGDVQDLLSLVVFVQRSLWADEIIWVDFDSDLYGYSIETHVVRILMWEDALRRLGLIKGIKLYLQSSRGEQLLRSASSGELALITSLAYLAISAKRAELIVIDEPENSLHPRWQRDYLGLLVGVLGYTGAKVVVATHSPLLVMAATELAVEAETLVLSEMFSSQVKLDDASIEEVMAEVFHTYTPKSSYLSRTLVEIMDEVESGKMSSPEASEAIKEIEQSGVDARQRMALDAVVEMVDRIVEKKGGGT